jgi:hypothetical protein
MEAELLCPQRLPAAAERDRGDEQEGDQVLDEHDDPGRCQLACYFSQRAHDRDAEERRRRQGCAEDHVLRFVTGVGAEHGRLPQLGERRRRRCPAPLYRGTASS